MKKLNNVILKIVIALIVIVIIAIFSAGGFYKLTGSRLDTVEGKVESIENIGLTNIENDIDYHDDRLYEQEKEVFGLKKEVSHLAEKVDRNFKDQQDFRIEQRVVQKQILDEIKEIRK